VAPDVEVDGTVDEVLEPAVWPGTEPGPALVSVVYSSVLSWSWSWGNPAGPGPRVTPVTLTARCRFSRRYRNSVTAKYEPVAPTCVGIVE
jgi:hypothetical protein